MSYISNMRKYIGRQPMLSAGATVVVIKDNKILLNLQVLLLKKKFQYILTLLGLSVLMTTIRTEKIPKMRKERTACGNCSLFLFLVFVRRVRGGFEPVYYNLVSLTGICHSLVPADVDIVSCFFTDTVKQILVVNNTVNGFGNTVCRFKTQKACFTVGNAL